MVKRLELWEGDAGGTENSKQPDDCYQDSLASKVNDLRFSHQGLNADKRKNSFCSIA